MYDTYTLIKKLPRTMKNVNFDRKDIEKLAPLIECGGSVSFIAALALHLFIKNEKSDAAKGRLVVKFTKEDYSGEPLVPSKVRLVTEDVEIAEKLSSVLPCTVSEIVRYAFHCYVKALPWDKILNNDKIFK